MVSFSLPVRGIVDDLSNNHMYITKCTLTYSAGYVGFKGQGCLVGNVLVVLSTIEEHWHGRRRERNCDVQHQMPRQRRLVCPAMKSDMPESA